MNQPSLTKPTVGELYAEGIEGARRCQCSGCPNWVTGQGRYCSPHCQSRCTYARQHPVHRQHQGKPPGWFPALLLLIGVLLWLWGSP